MSKALHDVMGLFYQSLINKVVFKWFLCPNRAKDSFQIYKKFCYLDLFRTRVFIDNCLKISRKLSAACSWLSWYTFSGANNISMKAKSLQLKTEQKCWPNSECVWNSHYIASAAYRHTPPPFIWHLFYPIWPDIFVIIHLFDLDFCPRCEWSPAPFFLNLSCFFPHFVSKHVTFLSLLLLY